MKKILNIWPYIFLYLIYYIPFKLEEAFMVLFLAYTLIQEKVYNFKINYKLFIMILTISIISIVQASFNGYPVDRTYEQIILIGVMYIGYDKLFKKYGFEKLFSIYLKISYFVAFLGILQLIIFFFLKKDILAYPLGSNERGITEIADRIVRVRSIAFEPGWLAQTMLPAFLYSLEGILKTRKIMLKQLLIIVCFIFTFSSGAYVVIPVYFIITRMKKISFKAIISMGIGVCLSIFLTKSVWIDKYYQTIGALAGLKTGIFKEINASSFAILSNLYVALNNNNLLFGTGLGTHPYSYFRNFQNRETGAYHFYGLNAMDAYSLGSRIISEMGILIFIIFLLIIMFRMNRRNNSRGFLNSFFLAGILSFFIRGGLYTRFGTTFIVLMFFNTGRKKEKNKNENTA